MTEKDPHGKSAKGEGSKLDLGKPKVVTMCLAYFPRALCAVANLSEKGAVKYTPGGWATVKHGRARYADAMGRHLLKECMGEEVDHDPYMTPPGTEPGSEDEMLHATQQAWNSLAKLEMIIAERTGEPIKPLPKWVTAQFEQEEEDGDIHDAPDPMVELDHVRQPMTLLEYMRTRSAPMANMWQTQAHTFAKVMLKAGASIDSTFQVMMDEWATRGWAKIDQGELHRIIRRAASDLDIVR